MSVLCGAILHGPGDNGKESILRRQHRDHFVLTWFHNNWFNLSTWTWGGHHGIQDRRKHQDENRGGQAHFRETSEHTPVKIIEGSRKHFLGRVTTEAEAKRCQGNESEGEEGGGARPASHS